MPKGLTIGMLREILEKLDRKYDDRPVVVDPEATGPGDDRVVLYEGTYTPDDDGGWFALTLRVDENSPVLDTRDW